MSENQNEEKTTLEELMLVIHNLNIARYCLVAFILSANLVPVIVFSKMGVSLQEKLPNAILFYHTVTNVLNAFALLMNTLLSDFHQSLHSFLYFFSFVYYLAYYLSANMLFLHAVECIIAIRLPLFHSSNSSVKEFIIVASGIVMISVIPALVYAAYILPAVRDIYISNMERVLMLHNNFLIVYYVLIICSMVAVFILLVFAYIAIKNSIDPTTEMAGALLPNSNGTTQSFAPTTKEGRIRVLFIVFVTASVYFTGCIPRFVTQVIVDITTKHMTIVGGFVIYSYAYTLAQPLLTMLLAEDFANGSSRN